MLIRDFGSLDFLIIGIVFLYSFGVNWFLKCFGEGDLIGNMDVLFIIEK